jgi:hypothetical protein
MIPSGHSIPSPGTCKLVAHQLCSRGAAGLPSDDEGGKTALGYLDLLQAGLSGSPD